MRDPQAAGKWLVWMTLVWVPLSALAEQRPHLPEESPKTFNRHWAFLPMRQPAVPQCRDTEWIRTPVDAFVLARLERAGLTPSRHADRRTLIRRVCYSLTGLPPSASDVHRFVNDSDPNAYEHLVERLLRSPHYGEQWARHWLDVARYSDTKGYVYAREERFWVHAWAYRDWVLKALNDDMPYDRFLLLQLAADQMPDRAPGDLAAMGFLTLGRRFLGVKHDIIDDRIDVVCRGTMGLTVSCARCHDHKYDPIATADYYSLYGVFDSCTERMVRLDDRASESDEAFENELRSRQDTLQTQLAAARRESSARTRERVGDYLEAQTELEKYPAEGFDQILQKSDLLPAMVRRWAAYLRKTQRCGDPVFAAWHAYWDLPSESFAEQATKVTSQLQASAVDRVNPLVAAAFVERPASFSDVIERYTTLFERINADWLAALKGAGENSAPPEQLSHPAAEQLRRVLYGPGAPCEVPDESILNIDTYFDTATCEELWKLQGEVDRWIINSRAPVGFATILNDRAIPTAPRILLRGDSASPGEEVARQFLPILAGDEQEPFSHGSGRLELAHAIVDPANPLTARVLVNRVWAYHFGQGLVTTPSDFGTRADPPSHPELLDWLATRFVEEGWSLKKLQRWIVLSATFCQLSAGPADQEVRRRALNHDPENRLLWRMNARRLTFEELRDSMLSATGQLDQRVGGKPIRLFQEPFSNRRTIYGLVDRQFLPATLRTFDFANPDLHISQRSETTVPQQSLFFMNHPLVLEQARALAEVCSVEADPQLRTRIVFQRVLQRDPSAAEVTESRQFVEMATTAEEAPAKATADDWTYGCGSVGETSQRTEDFTELPHFTGDAWQGGPEFPDAQLGWVQLTAAGGHPGNDREHAAIRRWTAPRAMLVTIRSQLSHEAEPGDGIRAFIVSSRSGWLASTKLHQQAVELNVEALDVAAGETIDFVADIDEVLNNDQYLWSAEITEQTADAGGVVWNSTADFGAVMVERLTGWEQLAQLLLCTNEFLFVD